jgi:cytochrome b
MDIVEACECLRAWYGPPPAKKLQTFDEEATGQHEIDQGHMALTALMERIVVILVNLLVTGKMGFLMEICS